MYVFFIGVAASLAFGASYAGVKVALSGAYSQESSSSAASTVQGDTSNTLLVTSVECLTSKVQLTDINFHPNFLADLNNAISDSDAMIALVEKYGTHYYTSANMGGKLVMTTSTSSSKAATTSESSTTKAVQISFSAKVSGYGANADAAGSYSKATSENDAAQSDFESSSTHSSIISYGGAPGSFGPSGGDGTGASNWGDWAQTVDLQPVPLDYQLARIGTLFTGMTIAGNDVTEAWQDAEFSYYQSQQNNPGGVFMLLIL